MQGAFINLLRGAALAQGSFLIALATIAPDVDWSGDTNDGPVVSTKSSAASTGSTKTPAETGWDDDTTKTTTAPTSAPAGDVGVSRARSPWGWVVAAGSLSMAAAFVTAAAVVSRRFVHTLSVVSAAAAPRGAGGVGGAAATAAKSVTTEPIVKVVT
jgi:hypothetical protein